MRGQLAFYEPRTIHDSSLSKAIHGIVNARCGDTEGAYAFWRDGIAIDLGDDPHSSDDGIHAAATGAIWSGVIQDLPGCRSWTGSYIWHPDACALAKAGVFAALAECAAALHRDERGTYGDQFCSRHANALG